MLHRFRPRHHAPTAPPAGDHPSATNGASLDGAPAPAPEREAPTPAFEPGRLPMKTQASGADARTERIARQLRAEIAELRAHVGATRDLPERFTTPDLDAIADDPETAAALPPALLVRALVEARDRNARLERRLAKQRGRIEKLEEKVRDLKQERAWLRGRMETFEDVIAALHDNIEDLRLFRDSVAGPGPQQALPPAADALSEPRHGFEA